VRWPFALGYLFCNKSSTFRPERIGFQQTQDLGCKRMYSSRDSIRRATSSCNQGETSLRDLVGNFVNDNEAHRRAATGSRVGGRSRGMRMKAILWGDRSILVRASPTQSMRHLQGLALTLHLRGLRGCIWSALSSVPHLRHRHHLRHLFRHILRLILASFPVRSMHSTSPKP
jgi:hypothetical protein